MYTTRTKPASLPLIRTWEEGVVVRRSKRLYAKDASGQRFLIRKCHAAGLAVGDMIMFVPGRIQALMVAPL